MKESLTIIVNGASHEDLLDQADDIATRYFGHSDFALTTKYADIQPDYVSNLTGDMQRTSTVFAATIRAVETKGTNEEEMVVDG